jgi:hypothetical protein
MKLVLTMCDDRPEGKRETARSRLRWGIVWARMSNLRRIEKGWHSQEKTGRSQKSKSELLYDWWFTANEFEDRPVDMWGCADRSVNAASIHV